MIYEQMFSRVDRIVRTGIIGTGQYATALVTQSPAVRQLEVTVVCDSNPQAAVAAYKKAGHDPGDITICDTATAALPAIESGRHVVITDPLEMMRLPVDVVVESTGEPAAGAAHAVAAIEHGKHVAMVNKETDAVVGPVLKHHADRAGLVYSAVDGDQHGLLMGLVSWARALGLDVIAAGKSLDAELVYDRSGKSVGWRDRQFDVSANEDVFDPANGKDARATVARRREVLGQDVGPAGYDITELTIAANGTGLRPDVPELHGPIAYTPEIPEVLATREEGGLLGAPGAIDCVCCLRQPGIAGLGGGVFVVVGCENDYSREMLASKGLLTNKAGTAALIYRPYHLCGVETATTVLAAGLLNIPTGTTRYRPAFDMVAKAKRDLPAGEQIGDDHSQDLMFFLQSARASSPADPIPFHLASGSALTRRVAAGEWITWNAVERERGSPLLTLRAEQDRVFL